MTTSTNQHHLLEITIISAQDLFPSALALSSYALAWIDPFHKLSTPLDLVGGSDPEWNDKFVFCVDDEFLKSETAAITIHIMGAHRHLRFLLPDQLLGTVRVLVSSFRQSPSTRFLALQVRRPHSLRPQGILNLAVAILDSEVSTVPLYYDLGAPAAFAYRDLNARPRKFPGVVDLNSRMLAVSERRSLSEKNMSGPLALVGERERKELESKLEKWKSDLLPQTDNERKEVEGIVISGGDQKNRRRRRRRRAFSCFSGHVEVERTRTITAETGDHRKSPSFAAYVD